MMRLPDAGEVADIPGGLNHYLMWMKNMACVGCHQMGQASTRTMPANLAHIEDDQAAWAQRIAAGQAGNRYFDESAPFKTRKTDLERCGHSLGVALQIHDQGAEHTSFSE